MRHVAGWSAVVGFVVMVSWVAGGAIEARQEPNVAASKGWVKTPAPGETTATAFVFVDNPTMYDTYIVSAEADVAGSVEFRVKAPGGEAEERAAPFVNVPAHESISMGPDGVHLLLKDLKRSLQEGETVALTLTTDSSVVMKVPAVVRKE